MAFPLQGSLRPHMSHFCKGKVSERMAVTRYLSAVPLKANLRNCPLYLNGYTMASLTDFCKPIFHTDSGCKAVFFECQNLEFLRSMHICLTLGRPELDRILDPSHWGRLSSSETLVMKKGNHIPKIEHTRHLLGINCQQQALSPRH